MDVTPFAKWAVALLVIMVLATPTGVGILVGATVSTGAGIGGAIATLGVTAGVGSRWIGDS